MFAEVLSTCVMGLVRLKRYVNIQMAFLVEALRKCILHNTIRVYSGIVSKQLDFMLPYSGDVAPCGPYAIRRFGRKYRFHLQKDKLHGF
jgi:hypothetical protein